MAKDPQELILGVWERDLFSWEDVEQYDYETLSFYSDGLGQRVLWKRTSATSATGHFTLIFTWQLNGENLQLDYGFGYIHNYRDVKITDSFLDMDMGTNFFLYSKNKNRDDRNVLKDNAMQIIGEWSMTDPENGAFYRINFRTDGSYEAHCSKRGSGSEIVERGSYQVHNSRVRFNSTTSGSLLNGRIFLITFMGTKEMDLHTENEVPITAYKVN